MRNRIAVLAAAIGLAGPASAQFAITSADDLYPDVSPTRGEVVINVLGDLWRVPETGGVATRLVETEQPAARARWSPDARRLVYETGGDVDSTIRLYDIDSGATRTLGPERGRNRHPDWHPSGDRIVFASLHDGSGFDLREIDLATGLDWRLTSAPGDDLEPAWSADGRDLVWIRRLYDRWQLMLRPFGQPERVLAASDTPLGAPSFRPDGTLVTYFREAAGQYELRMAILADPVIDRLLADDRDLFPARVSWKDRSTFYYTAADELRQRDFNAWTGRTVPFRASPTVAAAQPVFEVASRDLPLVSPAPDRVVLRAGRLWDGLSRSYRPAADILIEGGLIADVTDRRDWADTPIIDLQSTTALPGFVDVYARLPDADPRTAGARLLAWGVTTVVAERGPVAPDLWEGETWPGPRLLEAVPLDAAEADGGTPPFLVLATGAASGSAAERVSTLQAAGIPVLADDWSSASRLDTVLLPAAESAAPVAALMTGGKPSGAPRQRIDLTRRQLVSGLADRRTPGLDELFMARQADGLRPALPLRARTPLLEDLRRSRAPVALASADNGLPAGLATHAEFLALRAAGLANDQVLRSAGRYAAGLLGLQGHIGELTVGARADLVLVTGDPLEHIEDARRIVAVMRNGRFHSLSSLIERGSASVEEFDNNMNETPVAE